jgi:hypothetical protein
MVAPLLAGLLRAAARSILVDALSPDKNKPSTVGYVAITDWRDLLRELNKIEPQYARDLKRNFRKIATPMRSAISRAIPKTHPTSGIHVRGAKNVSGFAPVVVPGRLSWSANAQNGNIQPRHTVIRLTKAKAFKKIGQYGQMSIVKVEVDNAAVVMADMAGRSKKWVNKKPMTREYEYSRRGVRVKRKHRINGQGMGMIRALNRGQGVLKGDASRWIWPTANKHLPNVRYQINDLIRKANSVINERMKTR